MWHPFQIMPGEIAVEDSLIATAKPSAHCRMTYRERVIRWFLRETNEEGHWLPNVDERTGMVIEKRNVSGDSFELRVLHQKDLGVRHVLSGTMLARRNDWRSPVEWVFEQHFQGGRGIRNFYESGEWRSGTAKLVSRRKEEFVRTEKVESLTCLYTLLADFPGHLEAYPKSSETSVLEDLSVIHRGAKLRPISTLVATHPMARRLSGYALDYKASLPVEFWVNALGAVIYVCVGPNRTLFLESLEDLS